jgi:DNA polymerase delta subunit 1
MKIEACRKESIRDYKGEDGKTDFLKITTAVPSFVASIRGWLRQDRQLSDLHFHTTTYESNMPYALRFMIDTDIVGMGWVRLKAGKYKNSTNPLSTCQLEIEVDYRDLENLSLDTHSSIAPLRVLSFDIECAA